MSKLQSIISQSVTNFATDIEKELLARFANLPDTEGILVEDVREEIKSYFEDLRSKLAK